MLGFVAVFALLGLGVLVAFAPAIASGFVPGIVKGAAKSAIAGDVSIASASLSWGGPLKFTGVELKESGGKVVAKVDAEVSAGLWALIRGSRDLGMVTLSGKADLIKSADGSTNLERATAPAAGAAKVPVPTGPSAGPTLPAGLAAKLVVTSFDATLQELNAAGAVVGTPSVKKLTGDIAFAGHPAKATADLNAVVGDGKGSGTLDVKLTVTNFADAQGQLTLGAAQADVALKTAGLPVALIDAAANLKGLLVEALGPSANINVVAKGDAKAGSASIDVQSPNAVTSLAVKLADGIVTAEKPGAIRFQSTAFLGRLPAIREALEKAGITVESWPVFDATVASLTLPVPKGGASAGAAGGAGELDLRGVGLSMEVKTTAVLARLKPRDAAEPTNPVGAAPTPAMAAALARARGQALAVAPVTLSIQAADLAKGLKIKANTTATLDNQSAGALALEVEAFDLLDARGGLALASSGAAGASTKPSGAAATAPGRITGRLSAERVAITLAQPFLSGLDLPIDIATDIGPTVDVTAAFQSIAGGTGAGSGPVPAVDADLLLDSQNVRITAPLRLSERVLTTREPITIEIGSAGEAGRRFLSRGTPAGAMPTILLTGDPSVRVSVTDVNLPLDAAGAGNGIGDSTRRVEVPKAEGQGHAAESLLARLAATASVQVRGATIALRDAPAAGPLTVQSLGLEASMRPGQVARAKVEGALTHRDGPFRIEGDLALPGVMEALQGGGAGGGSGSRGVTTFIPGMGPMRVQGAIRVIDAPMSLADFAGSTGSPGQRPMARDSSSANASAKAQSLATLLSGVVGQRATVALTLEPGKTPADGQTFAIAITGDGLSANVAGDLTAARARVQSLAAEATVRPETVQAFIPSTDDEGRPVPQTIAMRAPARIAVTGQPFAVPFRAGTLTPDWASAGDATVAVTLREPLLVTGIPMASAGDKGLSGGLRGVQASATVPLAMLDPAAKPSKGLAATLDGTLLLSESQVVGVLKANVSVLPDKSAADVAATITGLDAAALDGMLGKPGLVSGALGSTADVTVSMRQDLAPAASAPGAAGAAAASKPLRARVQVSKSPRLTTDPLEIVIDDSRIALVSPAKIAWTIDPAWADQYLLAGTPDKPQAYRLVGPTALSLDLKSLAISKPETVGGLTKTGPFKPGVFALDVSAAAIKVQLVPLGNGATGQPITLDGVAIDAKSTTGNAITLGVRAASVSGGSGAGGASQPVTLTGTIKDVAASNGALDAENLIADINLQAPAVPTALIDALGGMNGRVTELLGPQLRASLTTVNFTRRPGGQGQLAVDVRAFRPTSTEPAALFMLDAPVRDGVVMVPAPKPLRLELAEFNVGEESALIQTLGIVASMSKSRLDAKGQPNPAKITSSNLRLPLGWRRGERQQLNGDIDVALGVVNYNLRTGFASLIQSTMLKDASRGVQQPAMKPFRVTIRNGIAEYAGVEIPIKVGLGLGEEIVMIPLSGKVNLVDETIDAEASLPLELVSSSVLSVLPIGLSDIRRDLLGTMEKDPKTAPPDAAAQAKAQKQRSIRIPVRVYGPMSEPKFAVDVDLFGARSGNLLEELTKNPAKAIEGIQDAVKGIEGLFKKPKK